MSPTASERLSSRRIVGYVYFTFVVYLAIGLPLAILPAYVHFRLGFSAALAGLVISIQYIATFLSRPWAGRISDRSGAKVSVIWGLGMCTASGGFLVAAALLRGIPWISVTALGAEPPGAGGGAEPGVDRGDAVGDHGGGPGAYGQGHLL